MILLIIIGAAAGTFYKFKIANTNQSQTIVLKFYAEEVPEFVTRVVQKDDVVVDDTKSTYLGKITDVVVDEAVAWGVNDKGEYVRGNKEGMKSILITAEVDGAIGNNGAVISSINYGIGHSLAIRAGKAKIWARVYDIQPK